MPRAAVGAPSWPVRHGPGARLLIPCRAAAKGLSVWRGASICAVAKVDEMHPVDLLWRIASDRLEDELLREEGANGLVAEAGDDRDQHTQNRTEAAPTTTR